MFNLFTVLSLVFTQTEAVYSTITFFEVIRIYQAEKRGRTFFYFIFTRAKVPTASKLEGGRVKALMALPLRKKKFVAPLGERYGTISARSNT